MFLRSILVLGSFFCVFYLLGSLRLPWIQVINPTLYKPPMFTETLYFNAYFALIFTLSYGWVYIFNNHISFNTFTKTSQRSIVETFLIVPAVMLFLLFSYITWANFDEQNVFLSAPYYSILYMMFSFLFFLFASILFSNIHTNEVWEPLRKEETERFYKENREARIQCIAKKLKAAILKKIYDRVDEYLDFKDYSVDELVIILYDDPEISYLIKEYGFLLFNTKI